MSYRSAAVLVVVLLFLWSGRSSFGQDVMTAPVGTLQAYELDTGLLDNPSDQVQLVYEGSIVVVQADWVRIYFAQTNLASGSTLVLQSAFDGSIQHLDAEHMAQWQDTSAYFNGDTVLVSLYAGPQTRGNRLVVGQVATASAMGSVAGNLCGVCNGDDRTLSEAAWAARMMPVGCTASMYSPSGCFVTAGHCVDGGGFGVMQFNVPPSLANGILQHPGPEDQYIMNQGSIDFVNGGVGDDWAFFLTFDNSETGLSPIEVQGEFRPIAASLPEVFPVAVEVWGYGVSDIPTHSQSQALSTGMLVARTSNGVSTAWSHRADTTGGNSGSALLHNGQIIGIVTHCTVGCPNIATPVNWPPFVAARSSCPDPELAAGDCDADADMDISDFAFFPACLEGPGGEGAGLACACSDVRVNNLVDLSDFATLQNNFTGERCVPPVLINPPQNQIVCQGDRVVLEAEVGSYHVVQYQWLDEEGIITGADAPSLVIDDFTAANLGTYAVMVQNACGTTLSEPFILSPCTAEILRDNFETDQGWSVTFPEEMVRGWWERAVPEETADGGSLTQPGTDNPGGIGTLCFVTGAPGGLSTAGDVDGGPTILTSPLFDLSVHEAATLSYAYWLFRDNDAGHDALEVSVSNDGGASWVPLARHAISASAWRTYAIDLGSMIAPTDEMQVRFLIEDLFGDTVLEALLDDVRITASE